MKILIVCRYKAAYPCHVAPFIKEQTDALQQSGVNIEWFKIHGSYIKSIFPFFKKLKVTKPDIVHAHYGLSGLFANLQRRVPVVTTFHGSDINQRSIFLVSKLAMKLSRSLVFVTNALLAKSTHKTKSVVVPCGVDTSIFHFMPKDSARQQLNIPLDEKIALFSGRFDNPVKNAKLAIEAVSQIENLELFELKGYDRNDVAMLMNAVDVCLMTSHTEGSPQFIKEAMACNCPIVTVNVGDVNERLSGVDGCHVTDYNVQELVSCLVKSIERSNRTNGRKKLLTDKLDNEAIAQRLIAIYNQILCL
jgi:teichuronic acid biosynthesis glycosyltransferase TuaC